VHRIVAALVAERLLVENERGALLALGPRLIQLASRSWGRSDLRLAAVDELKRLRDLTGETVHLAVPNGSAMVYIEKLESPSAVRMASRIGTSVSLHATAVGKAYMAALEPAALEPLLQGLPLPRYTGNTLPTLPELRKQLQVTRERGWSVDAEEHEAGIFCYGAVIRGSRGAACGRDQREHLDVPAEGESRAGLCGALAGGLPGDFGEDCRDAFLVFGGGFVGPPGFSPGNSVWKQCRLNRRSRRQRLLHRKQMAAVQHHDPALRRRSPSRSWPGRPASSPPTAARR
jgi:DNA-binding IclR family transcriptional regulator